MRAVLDGRDPVPTQRPYAARAEGWAARLRGDAAGAERFLRDAVALAESPGYAAQLAYEALRAGATARARPSSRRS